MNNQNVEYFENLACEYTLQYQLLMSKPQATSPDKPLNGDEEALMTKTDADGSQIISDGDTKMKSDNTPKINEPLFKNEANSSHE